MHLSVQLSACVDNSWCSIDVEVVRIDATRINVVGHWIIVWISRRYCTNLGIWVGGMEGRRVQVVIQVGLNELHLPSGNPSRIWNTARGALNIGPTFPAVHKLGKHGCVCCRKREEGEKKSRLLPGCPQTWCRQLPWPLTQETSRQSSRHCSLAIAHASVGTACVSRNCSHQIHNRVDQCTTKNGSHAVQLQVTAASSHSRFKNIYALKLTVQQAIARTPGVSAILHVSLRGSCPGHTGRSCTSLLLRSDCTKEGASSPPAPPP